MKDQGMYIIRTQAGLLIAELSNEIAQKLIKRCKGHFRSIRFESKTEKTVFQFDEDSVWGLPQFRIFLYTGYMLIPD